MLMYQRKAPAIGCTLGCGSNDLLTKILNFSGFADSKQGLTTAKAQQCPCTLSIDLSFPGETPSLQVN